MTPVDQEFTSKPEIGQYGDCQRAAIASLLDLPLSEVPHFLQEANGDAYLFHSGIKKFMNSHGLMLINVYDSNELPDCMYYLIYGPSPRGNGLWHAVVGMNGKIVHDPHPSKDGLLEPDKWHYHVLKELPKPVVSDDKDAY